MARIILLLSGALIAVVAIPAYFLLCIWISIAETLLFKKKEREEKEEHNDER